MEQEFDFRYFALGVHLNPADELLCVRPGIVDDAWKPVLQVIWYETAAMLAGALPSEL